MNKKGVLVLYSGCSGVGKGTIMKQLLLRDPMIRLSVSNTTRQPREGEIPGVLSIFIVPPSLAELERRLRGRGTEDDKTVIKRMAQAEKEIEFSNKYKYKVVNDDVDRAVGEILDILHRYTEE